MDFRDLDAVAVHTPPRAPGLGLRRLRHGFPIAPSRLGLLHHRLVLRPLPPAQLPTTLWIGLGPVGVAALAPLALARAGKTLFDVAAPTVTVLQIPGEAEPSQLLQPAKRAPAPACRSWASVFCTSSDRVAPEW